jgi:hypothetical protein
VAELNQIAKIRITTERIERKRSSPVNWRSTAIQADHSQSRAMRALLLCFRGPRVPGCFPSRRIPVEEYSGRDAHQRRQENNKVVPALAHGDATAVIFIFWMFVVVTASMHVAPNIVSRMTLRNSSVTVTIPTIASFFATAGTSVARSKIGHSGAGELSAITSAEPEHAVM